MNNLPTSNRLGNRKLDVNDGELFIICYKHPKQDHISFIKFVVSDVIVMNLIEDRSNWCAVPSPADSPVFYTKEEAEIYRRTITDQNGEPLIGHGYKNSFVTKVKHVCQIYYVISLKSVVILSTKKKDYISISKEWYNNEIGDPTLITKKYFFKLNEFDKFVEKFREVRSNLVNEIYQRLIELQEMNPNNLL